jgi:4-amino-4-deoxy-L-arabinose transferase-like glycosyltransferase
MSGVSVVIVGVTLRLAVPIVAFVATWDPLVFHDRDTESYIEPAANLISTGRFAVGGVPEIHRTPGYPILLIPGLLLDRVSLVTILLQVILSGVTIYTTYRIAELLFKDRWVAGLCGLVLGVEPVTLYYSSHLSTECLFLTVLTLSLYCLLRFVENRSMAWGAWAAALLVMGIYARPIGSFLPMGLTIILLIHAGIGRSRRLAVGAVVFLSVSMAGIGVWYVRNAIWADYAGFSSISDEAVYFYSAASVLAAENGIGYYDQQRMMGLNDVERYLADHPEQRTWTPGKRYQYMRREGVGVLRRYPLTYGRIHVRGMLMTLLDPGATSYLKLFKLHPDRGGLLERFVDRDVVGSIRYLFMSKPLVFWSNAIMGMFLLTIYVLAVIGVSGASAPRGVQLAMLVATGGYLIVAGGGPVGYSRFRHPVLPILSIFGGYGLAILLEPLRGHWVTALKGRLSRGGSVSGLRRELPEENGSERGSSFAAEFAQLGTESVETPE